MSIGYKANVNSFQSNLLNLFLTSTHFDFTIILDDDQKFNVHQAFLTAQSPVFDRMLSNELMEEYKSNSISIPNVTYEVMSDFLKYLYTGQTPLPDRLTKDLLIVADKYQVANLKFLCETQLMITISIENVLSMLIFADMYSTTNLMDKCYQFTSTNFTNIVRNNHWLDFTTQHPILSSNLVNAFANFNHSAQIDCNFAEVYDMISDDDTDSSEDSDKEED